MVPVLGFSSTVSISPAEALSLLVLQLGEGRKSLSNSCDGPRSGYSQLESPSGLQIMKLH